MKNIVILSALHSNLISEGLIKIIHSFKLPFLTITSIEEKQIKEKCFSLQPSIIFLEPLFHHQNFIEEIRKTSTNSKLIGITSMMLPEEITKLYDEIISIYDPISTYEKILKGIYTKKEEEQKELSPREKEIVIGIVKGKSNKEIAADNNISVHTVMTHRKNIATKLQIHSIAGLTIYAIVSKLVKLEDINF